MFIICSATARLTATDFFSRRFNTLVLVQLPSVTKFERSNQWLTAAVMKWYCTKWLSFDILNCKYGKGFLSALIIYTIENCRLAMLQRQYTSLISSIFYKYNISYYILYFLSCRLSMLQRQYTSLMTRKDRRTVKVNVLNVFRNILNFCQFFFKKWIKKIVHCYFF